MDCVLPIAGPGGIEMTVDQILVREMGAAGLRFVSGLPLAQMARVTVSSSLKHNKGCPGRPPRRAMGTNIMPPYA